MYKEDLALHNLQWLIYHETKQNPTKPHQMKFVRTDIRIVSFNDKYLI